MQVEKLGKESLINCAKTSMSSKIIGTDSNFFAKLASNLTFSFSLARCGSHSFHEGQLDSVVAEYV
jgi:chaperonin GroEL (HSP60 family)